MKALIKYLPVDGKPKVGDMVKSVRGWTAKFGEHEDSYPKECTILKPFAVNANIEVTINLLSDIELREKGYIREDGKYYKILGEVSPEATFVKDGGGYEVRTKYIWDYDKCQIKKSHIHYEDVGCIKKVIYIVKCGCCGTFK